MRVTLLGATGSIGTSALEVISKNQDTLTLYAAACGSNVEGMLGIITRFHPQKVALASVEACQRLKAELKNLKGPLPEVLEGEKGICELAADPEGDYVIAAIVGAAGLKPVLAAADRGALIGLANKEALVMSGALFFERLHKGMAQVFPIDSEHSAIFQCLPEECQLNLGSCDLEKAGVHHILLTGSGGPFRTTPLEDLNKVSAKEALHHPIWSMGPKITIDSATMMNKGLEYIEARYLFNAREDQMEVIIHPQSVVHSMVSYKDGAILAQMGAPDMKTPIARALAYPKRILSNVEPLDFSSLGTLSFSKPDYNRYPCLKLAKEASRLGQAVTTALNAANEIAVGAFLKEQISYLGIYKVVAKVVEALDNLKAGSLEEILETDRKARDRALAILATGERF